MQKNQQPFSYCGECVFHAMQPVCLTRCGCNVLKVGMVGFYSVLVLFNISQLLHQTEEEPLKVSVSHPSHCTQGPLILPYTVLHTVILDVYRCSGVCIWLKTTMNLVPLDLIETVSCMQRCRHPCERVGEKVNLRSYQKLLASADHLIPNRIQGIHWRYIHGAGNAHWPPSFCYDSLTYLCEEL